MLIDLQTEASLDPTIQLQATWPEPVSRPKAIFLTGSTGFLGAYLLFHLLQETRATIYCLVQSATVTAAQQRLEKQLGFYQLWQEPFRKRLVPIVGNLSQPYLGISKQQFNQLANQVEVIYHSAAKTTPVYPYKLLKAVNVTGTEEVIRFATTGHPKALHYISSVVTFFSQPYLQRDGPILETEIPVLDSTLTGGYKQSKWVAEQLVWQAKERGLPVSVYRPSRIIADTKTGITGRIDLFWKMVNGCLMLKKYPDIETDFNLVPIDYVSRAIIHVTHQNCAFGQAFHVVNPTSISWRKLWQHIQALGYAVEPTSYDNWIAEINQQATENKLMAQLRVLLRTPIVFFKFKPKFDDCHIQHSLSNSTIYCPSIDTAHLQVYLNYFQKTGYISA